MTLATIRRVFLLLILGGLWGGLAFALGASGLGPGVWAGVLLSPLIGIVVGGLTQSKFEELEGFRRWLLALGSLYLGGTLFGLIVGAAGSLHRGLAWPRFLDGLLEGVVSIWWGMTLTGFLLLLWPAAYLTHSLVAREGER